MAVFLCRRHHRPQCRRSASTRGKKNYTRNHINCSHSSEQDTTHDTRKMYNVIIYVFFIFSKSNASMCIYLRHITHAMLLKCNMQSGKNDYFFIPIASSSSRECPRSALIVENARKSIIFRFFCHSTQSSSRMYTRPHTNSIFQSTYPRGR